MSRELRQRLAFPFGFVVLLWAIHIGQAVTGIELVRLGVYPRAIDGLPGIFTSPLIHGSWEHLLANTSSMAILGAVLFWFYPRVAMRTFAMLYILSGLGVWLFAQPGSFHIGASGVIYGMVSFVFWSGIFRRNIKSIVLALVVLVLYAGFFEGIVPGKEGVSWESHLLGAVAGILLAWLYRAEIEPDEEPEPELPEEEREYFLPRDVFERKIHERDPFGGA
jgi:membrane associated rhomboid family serine protease